MNSPTTNRLLVLEWRYLKKTHNPRSKFNTRHCAKELYPIPDVWITSEDHHIQVRVISPEDCPRSYFIGLCLLDRYKEIIVPEQVVVDDPETGAESPPRVTMTTLRTGTQINRNEQDVVVLIAARFLLKMQFIC